MSLHQTLRNEHGIHLLSDEQQGRRGESKESTVLDPSRSDVMRYAGSKWLKNSAVNVTTV
jgi:hypothetical protein